MSARGSLRVCALLAVAIAAAGETAAERARTLMAQGKPREALPLLLELYRAQPRNAPLCQQIGLAYTQLEQLPQAADFYRRALAADPNLFPARKNLATVLWFLDQKAESERLFLAVLKARPEDPVPHLYLGLAGHARGQFASAREHFAKAGALAWENPEVLPAVLDAYLADPGVALPPALLAQLEQRAAANQISSAGCRLLGEAYDRQGQPQKAYTAYRQAIELDARGEEGYLALAAFAVAHQNREFAMQVVRQGLSQSPGSARLHLEEGLLHALAGDREKAESGFLQASRLAAHWSVPLLALGVSQLEAGETAAAARTFRQAAAADPADARAEYLYAAALIRAGAQQTAEGRQKIVPALRRALRLDPKDARSHAALGQTYLAAGQTEAAARELQTAIHADPENQTALYQLAMLYRRQGNQAEAERALREFERLKARSGAAATPAGEILRIVRGR